MRVVMVSEFPGDLDHPKGGVQAVAVALAHGLARQGVELTVIRFGASADPVACDAPFEIVDVSRQRPAIVANRLIARRKIDRIVDDVAPDVVHVQGIPELHRPSRIPAVLTVHGIVYRDAAYAAGPMAGLQAFLLRKSFEAALRRYGDVIVISPYVRQELGEVAGVRYHDVPNPIEDRFFEVSRRPNPGEILYVGTLAPRKNVLGLVRAAARARQRIPNLRLRVAGPWMGTDPEAFHAEIRRTGMSDAVDLLGSLPREQLLLELGRCSCVALPSFQETAPMAIQEAMGAGVPVVASRVGGIPWMIEDRATGLLFDPGDEDGLAGALTAVLGDTGLGDRVGEAARHSARAEYALSAVVSRTLELYGRVRERRSHVASPG